MCSLALTFEGYIGNEVSINSVAKCGTHLRVIPRFDCRIEFNIVRAGIGVAKG